MPHFRSLSDGDISGIVEILDIDGSGVSECVLGGKCEPFIIFTSMLTQAYLETEPDLLRQSM